MFEASTCSVCSETHLCDFQLDCKQPWLKYVINVHWWCLPTNTHTFYLGTGLFVKNTASDIVLFISHVVIKTGLCLIQQNSVKKYFDWTDEAVLDCSKRVSLSVTAPCSLSGVESMFYFVGLWYPIPSSQEMMSRHSGGGNWIWLLTFHWFLRFTILRILGNKWDVEERLRMQTLPSRSQLVLPIKEAAV